MVVLCITGASGTNYDRIRCKGMESFRSWRTSEPERLQANPQMYLPDRMWRNDTIALVYLCRHCCPGGPHVRCGGPRWLELSQHSGALGPAGPTMELRGQYVDAEEHHGSHGAQRKVSSFPNRMKKPPFLLRIYNFLAICQRSLSHTL